VYVRVPDIVLKGEPQLCAEDNLTALFFDVKILLHHLGDPQVAERLARSSPRWPRRLPRTECSSRSRRLPGTRPWHPPGLAPDRDVRRSRRGLAGHRSAPAAPKFGQDLTAVSASLLPGLPAATQTGLPPAGDDELTNTKNTMALRHGCTSRSAGRTRFFSIVKPAPPKQGKPRSMACRGTGGLRELWGYLSSASRRSRGWPRSGW